MEDEGICYYFKHEKGKHILVIRDSLDSKQTLKTKAEFIKATHKICPLGKVFNTSKNTFMNVSSYSTADYNYQNSKTKLFSKLETKWKGQTLFYEYPGGFSQASEGELLIFPVSRVVRFRRRNGSPWTDPPSSPSSTSSRSPACSQHASRCRAGSSRRRSRPCSPSPSG